VMPDATFCGICAKFYFPAMPCCWAPTWKKDIKTQILAYDDPAGVTAAFNLNILGRINRELGANFDLASFRHEARWNAVETSHRDASVFLAQGSRGDTSRQFARDTESRGNHLGQRAPTNTKLKRFWKWPRETGFRCEGQWIDAGMALRTEFTGKPFKRGQKKGTR